MAVEAYQNFLQEYVAPETYYAIENLGEHNFPVLLLGIGEPIIENGNVLFTGCSSYYFIDGQVVYMNDIGSIEVPLCIAEKDGQNYMQTSHNPHSVLFSFLRENGWYSYMYESNGALVPGITLYENGQCIIDGKQYETYISEYTEVGDISFYQNLFSASGEEMTKEPFYGVWCEAYLTYEDAADRAAVLSSQYHYDFQVVLTTDWSNLNTEPYYCITAGTYPTKGSAEAALLSVRQFNADAYVKYSGDWKSGIASTQTASEVWNFPDPFYGIWCEAFLTYEEAVNRAAVLSSQYNYSFQVFLTTDWSNLNTEPYYCITAGTYSTKESAEAALLSVRQFNADAYVKYSGDWKSGIVLTQKTFAGWDFSAPFYGVWCEAYLTYEEAANRAAVLSSQYNYSFQVFLTTDWSNLNTEPYYCITAGTYSTKESAEAALSAVQQFNANAYVKYSGEWKG